ncbi:hypothetical protein [Mesorhizobium sp. M0633]|uniref:hypothetical protein n=1 Tax=Mesorhizobium sp. M0633 TaxID=2956977 RepID=UPI00333B1932
MIAAHVVNSREDHLSKNIVQRRGEYRVRRKRWLSCARRATSERVRFWRFVLALLMSVGIGIGGLAAAPNSPQDITGKWTYRSFHNNKNLVTDNDQTALGLFFAEATFTFDVAADNTLRGTIDWSGGGLDLHGSVQPAASGAPLTVQIVGMGRAGTATQDWQYDYFGYLAHTWPRGVGQVPALVGSVIRAKPHNGAPAGYVASFVAVQQ